MNLVPMGLREWVRNVPLLATFQRWIVNRVLSGERFLHIINAGPAKGLNLHITLPADKAIWAGTYESAFASEIARGVRCGDVCYDIGGYRGYMAGVMALAGASRVFVFEPLPDNQQAIERLCGLNPSLRIEIMRIAIGSVNGNSRLLVMPDASMGKLEISPFQTGRQSIGEVDTVVRTLDSLVQEGLIPPPQMIKIDVEGLEQEVLLGATATIEANHPRIYIEVHSAELEEACVSELRRVGYGLRRLERHRPRPHETRHLIAIVK